MELSHRIRHLTTDSDGGWGIYFRVREMIDSGQDVINLTIGQHDIPTPNIILDAMNTAAKDGNTGYAAIPGVPALRERVARRLTERTGIETSYDNVLITAGGQAALFAVHHAVCDEGDTALFVDPYYPTYPGTIRAVGAVAQPIITRSRDAFRPRREELETNAIGATSLLINSPNNPTGTVYDSSTLMMISEVAKAHDLWLISDEVYDTQIWRGHHLSPRSLPDMRERTLVIGSMSKSHAMTGFRCGWVIGPKEAISRMINLTTHTTYGVPGFVQLAAAFALDQGSTLEREIAAPFDRRRQLAWDILNAQQTITAIPSDGAMYLMLDIRATQLSGNEFAQRLLDTHHIAVMPGESFGFAAAGHVRVAMTVEDERFGAALHTLCEFASSFT
ncbi:MAG: pyridoxal phosphate-dependent aminotransferase [Aestuariivita sp.]|nr:pyridoxal phosphate-dependent aminotransferase [Aestuariivita sp.]